MVGIAVSIVGTPEAAVGVSLGVDGLNVGKALGNKVGIPDNRVGSSVAMVGSADGSVGRLVGSGLGLPLGNLYKNMPQL